MKRLDKLEEILIAMILLFSTLLVVVNVGLRQINMGTTWSDELIRYLLIWVTFVGISVCVREGVHVSIDLVPGLLKGKAKKNLYMVIYVMAILLSLCLTYYSVLFVYFSYGNGQVSPGLYIPIYIVYLVLPISGLLMTVRYIQKIIELYRLTEMGVRDASQNSIL